MRYASSWKLTFPVANIELSEDKTSTSSAERNRLSELTSTFPERRYFSSRISLSSASISRLPELLEKISTGNKVEFSGQFSQIVWSGEQSRTTSPALTDK